MLRVLLVTAVLLASLAAGCTDKLSFGSTSSEDGFFTVEPAEGDKDTVFHVSAADDLRDRNLTWQFGDGSVAYGPEADHQYGFTNGVMTITLLVGADAGAPEVATRTVKLGSGVNKAPTVSLTAPKKWLEVGQSVNFTARGSDADRDPLTYLWTYTVLQAAAGGDGHGHDHGGAAPRPGEEVLVDATSSKAAVSFDHPGRYDLKVRARDPKGGEAVANVTIDVSRDIPDSQVVIPFSGTLVAGTAGAGLAEKAWVDPAPDTYADAARHAFAFDYPSTTYVMLLWNDSSNVSAYDLDMELRFAENKTTIFKAERHAVDPSAPAPPVGFPMEMNFTDLPAGAYEVVVRAFTGAQVSYTLTVYATLRLTPELVAAVEG